MSLERPLRGIVVPMLTPLSDNDNLDVPSLERLIVHLIPGGIHALFILGSTGEGLGLSYRLRRELVKRVSELVAGRVPILVGISDTSMVESLSQAACAAEEGAAGLVLCPPYYYSIGQVDLLRYVESIAPQLPLPVFLYNMPSLTKVCIEPATVRACADIPNVQGFKDSSADLSYFRAVLQVLAGRQDFSVLTGNEELLVPAVTAGAQGCVGGGANLFPKLYVSLYEAVLAGNGEEVRRLDHIVQEINDRVYTVGEAGTSYLKGLKCAAALLGLCSGRLAEPLHAFAENDCREIRRRLESIEVPRF